MVMAAALKNKRVTGSVLFLSLAFFLLLASTAYAVPACSASYPGTGTCSSPSGTSPVICLDMLGQDCCSKAGCDWTPEFEGGDSSCTDGVRSVVCSRFTDSKVACLEMGCDWTPAGSAGGCGSNDGTQGYGEACGSTSDCAKCLVCDSASGKCTQLAGVCTLNPAVYVMPLPDTSGASGGLSPVGAIENLSSGSQGGRGGAVVGASSNFYKVGWFSDWKSMGLIGVAIVCSIIALAAMIGKAFNLPEIKAFANNEIKQAVISALIIVSLVGLVAFFDEVARLSIQGADPPVVCASSEPCYVTAAKFYLTTLYDTGSGFAKNNLEESITKMKRATLGYNINMNKIYLAFAGFSIRFNAGDSLVAERHGAMFSQVSKILTSIYAQRYFIDVITFGVAPLFILLGIVLRTFFFTRKLGGLLLAIAISLFIVYPLTYAFAWYTLNVTVYGERTLAVSDPACPGECTATYPVAFFSDPQTGQLVQFPTIQSIIRTGINESNWNTGGPNLDGIAGNDFPGLVACRNLTSVGISAVNSCSECPDYCRDVPFPTNMPGCNITKCASCNPGCKIVRQRLNCETDPACAGQCPLKCRTQVPIENKCFDNETGGVIPANLSINCSGCEQFPAWCRFLFKNSSGLYPVYDDPVLNKACIGVDDPAICPSQCSYITQMGTDTTCDKICSVTNSAGASIVCPKQCRVSNLYNNSWASIYDVAPPNFTAACNETPDIAAACTVCNAHPECMVEVLPPLAGCAVYPTTEDAPASCLNCPDYCRRADFNNFFLPESNVDRSAANLPVVCDTAKYPSINCTTSGSPPACDISCRTTATPLICRPYEDNHDTDPTLCRGCPDNARYKVNYTKDDLGYACVNGIPVYFSGTGENAFLFAGSESSGQAAPGSSQATAEAAARQSDLGSGGSGSNKQTGAGSGTIRLAGSGSRHGTIWLASTPPLPIVANPYLTSVSLLPDPANTSSTLTGYCNGTDNGGADLQYNYTYYLNGVANTSGQIFESPSGWEVALPSISPPLIAGQNWSVSCNAFNGTAYSGWVNSGNLTIEALPNPTVTQSSSITPTLPYKTDTLKGFCNVTDASSATVTYDYQWYKNGAPFGTAGSTDPLQQGIKYNIANMSGGLSKGQNWTFSCRGMGTGTSEWLNSSNVTIQANPPEPPCTNTLSNINLTADTYHCSDASCPEATCQASPIYVTLPNEDDYPECQDANVTDCPYGCRVLDLDGYRNSECDELCAELPSYCFVTSPTVPLCGEYVGNGPKTCHSEYCIFLSESVCGSTSGCTWDANHCDKSAPNACLSQASQAACTATSGCTWVDTSSIIKISERLPEFGERTACRQCPEQCRLNSTSGIYHGNCGVQNNGAQLYVDCTESNCQAACRISQPAPPASPSCLPYPEDAGVACAGCPALCRRSSDLLSLVDTCPEDSCMLDADPAKGCTDACRQPDPPDKACENCFNCDFDCTYYPAIRTDCSDVCTDEALAGPVNIEPNDFIKKLPGAKTSEDGKWTREIGVLYIPAVLLPLFCIVMVVAFVRILSPVLGGDIEIPGLGKII